jgi:NDP-sugar pyrophosphorylase family protein
MNKKLFEQAVVFAGGRGERLRPLTDSIPKPMAPVMGRPFLDYLLKSLTNAGIKRILILVGYRAEKIMAYYGNLLQDGTPVEYSIGSEEDQTGRRLLNAYSKLEDRFLLLYGDNYWQPPLRDMMNNYESLDLPVTTTIFSNKTGTGEYGFGNNVYVALDKKVQAYDKTRKDKNLNGVDIGFFLVDKSVINPKEQGNISFEETILTRLVMDGSVGAFLTDEQYYYITSIESLHKFEEVASKLQLDFVTPGKKHEY